MSRYLSVPGLRRLAIAAVTACSINASAVFGRALAQAPLEEVVVRVRLRDENLQRTPVAASVFTAEAIESRQLTDLAELAHFAPNVELDFTAPISGSSNNASIFIRGVGQTDYVPGKDQGVGVYLDGVYLPRSVGSVLNLIDVERVEILRGPQGTLFGRNTIGGAIQLTTAAPHDEFEAGVDLTLGSRDRSDVRATINTPLTDALEARWTFGAFRRDGYVERLLAGDRMGNDDELAGRVKLVWRPNDRLSGTFSFDYSSADEQSTAATIVSTDIRTPTSPFSIGEDGTIFAGQAYNVLIGATGPGASTAFPFLPPLPATTIPYDRAWLTGDDFTTNATGPNYSEYDAYGLSARLVWTLPRFRIESISGVRSTEAQFGRDPDASPLVLFESEVWADYRQSSQELRVGGSVDSIDWVGGLFMLSETGKQRDEVPFVDETFRIYAANGIPIGNFLAANGPFSINDIDSVALFGEASFALTARLELSAGLRHTREARRTIANTTQGGVQAVVEPRASLRFNDTSGRLTLAYAVGDERTVYVSLADGFKSGGFNHRLALAPPGTEQLQTATSFAPERVESVEVGFKADMLAGRARLNSALFHSDYRDIQALVFDLGVPRTINAARGEIDGFEVEFGYVPVEDLRVDLSYGYLDARYTEFDASIPGAFGNPISIVPLTLDSQFVNTPEHSFAAGIEHALALGSGGRIALRADAQFRSETANDVLNTPELIQDDLWLVSASAGWQPGRCNCELVLFGRNLTDETFFVSGAADSASHGTAERIMAPQREWGLRLRYRFN